MFLFAAVFNERNLAASVRFSLYALAIVHLGPIGPFGLPPIILFKPFDLRFHFGFCDFALHTGPGRTRTGILQDNAAPYNGNDPYKNKQNAYA
jgi:hypothetical protein